MASIRNEVTDDLQDIIEYLAASESEIADGYKSEMATVEKNVHVTPSKDDKFLSFQGILDYLGEVECEPITKELDRQSESVPEHMGKDILYDCEICPNKQVSSKHMYCCVNCQKNTCHNCAFTSIAGDVFCSQMCLRDWEDFINYHSTQTSNEKHN